MSKSFAKESVDQGLHFAIAALLSYLTGAAWLGLAVGFIREHGSHAKKHGHLGFLWNDIVDDFLEKVTFRSVFKGTRLDLVFWTLGGLGGWLAANWW